MYGQSTEQNTYNIWMVHRIAICTVHINLNGSLFKIEITSFILLTISNIAKSELSDIEEKCWPDNSSPGRRVKIPQSQLWNLSDLLDLQLQVLRRAFNLAQE